MTPVSAQSAVHGAKAAISAVRQMLAAVYRGKGQVVVENIPVPEIEAGELLVRVAACGICGTDIKKIQHGFVSPPQVFGHEIAGTVVAVGRGVARWKVGDRVVCFHHIPCGDCFFCERKLFSQCPTYKKVGVTAGFTPNGGGFAQFVCVMLWIVEKGVVAIPPDVTFEEATWVEPVNTCLKAVEKARVAAGELIGVIGQGPIGLLLMMLSRLTGATVLTSDPMPERRRMSEELGAAQSFDPSTAGLQEEIRERSNGRGADAVLLAVPHPSLVVEALKLTRPGGRVLLFAHNDPQMQIDFPAAAVGVEEKEILGSYSADVGLQWKSAKLVFDRLLPLARLVTHRFPIEKFEQALGLAARPAGDSLKVVITP